jgi:hypothetical protein
MLEKERSMMNNNAKKHNNLLDYDKDLRQVVYGDDINKGF